jgi:carbon-monoxide dehydrogenase medium subunit
MSLPRFEYVAPEAVEEAVALWQEKPDARYLAGGTDLLTRMRFAEQRASRVVDIKRIADLQALRANGAVSIGAAVSVAQVAAHPAVQERYPALARCCGALGSYPIRQRATVAGNLCNASPCADTSAALLALDARLTVVGPGGRRTVPLEGFFTGPGQTVLQPGDLVTEVVVPAESAGARAAYGRLARRRGVDISTVAALVVRLAEGKPRWRVSLLSVAPTPLRVPEAEAILDELGPPAADQAAQAAQAACRPITDVRGTAEYRHDMVGVLVRRGVQAVARQRRV